MTCEKRNCDFCGNEYEADKRNLKRGWGMCCSKSCAAKKRERSRPDYDFEIVEINNRKREGVSGGSDMFPGLGNYDPGDDTYWDGK